MKSKRKIRPSTPSRQVAKVTLELLPLGAKCSKEMKAWLKHCAKVLEDKLNSPEFVPPNEN